MLLLLSLSALGPVLGAVVATAFSISPTFEDATARAGLPTDNPRKKYGGPTVVDLDRDGWPDLIFCHHDNYYAQVYYNQKGSFSAGTFRLWADNHGIVAAPVSPKSRNMRFALSVGGAYGNIPFPPQLFETNPSRRFFNITASAAVHRAGGRGRSSIFMDLSLNNSAYPDVLFLNAKPNDKGPSHFGYHNVGGVYRQQSLLLFEFDKNWYGTAVDIDGDRIMEVVLHYYKLTAYKLTAPFTFTDVTQQVFPPGIERFGVVALAEFDMDNDGDFDLYVARTKSGDLKWSPGKHFDDYLFENVGGRFVDVTDKAQIPRGTTARGVTVADFNNDGYMDIFVTQYIDPDVMLLNRGDGTFQRVDNLISRPEDVRGDNALAIDYDLDGRMDIVSSQGDQHHVNYKGIFKLFRNTIPLSWRSRYLFVRVGNAPDGSATPLHAVVTVRVARGRKEMVRRVGTPGEAVSKSYVETLHFGLGVHWFADSIQVVWSSGTKLTRRRRTYHGRVTTMGPV